MTTGPTPALPRAVFSHAPGVASLLPPHDNRPDAGASPDRLLACSGRRFALASAWQPARRWRFPGPARAGRGL